MILQVGVKVLLVNANNEVLLLLRSDKYGEAAGKWDIPGGRIEVGSSLLDNLKREVLEETGLEFMSEPQLIGAQDILKNDDRHIVRLTYTARADGEPVLDLVEHTEYRWVPREELKDQEKLDSYVRALLDGGKIVV